MNWHFHVTLALLSFASVQGEVDGNARDCSAHSAWIHENSTCAAYQDALGRLMRACNERQHRGAPDLVVVDAARELMLAFEKHRFAHKNEPVEEFFFEHPCARDGLYVLSGFIAGIFFYRLLS